MQSRQTSSGLVAAAGCCSLLIGAICVGLAMDDRPLTLALGLVGALAGALLVLIQPFVGLLLFLTMVYLRPGDRFPELEKLRLTLIIAAVTIAVWLAQYLIRRRPRLVPHPINQALAGLAVMGLVSYFPISVREGVSVVLQSISKVFLLYLLIINLVRTPGRLRAVCWLIVLLSASNAFTAVRDYRAVQQVTQAEDQGEERAVGVGVLADPNDLALTLVMVLPLAVALFLGERGFYVRLIPFLATLLLLAGIAVTKSRGGFLGLAMVLFLEGFQRLRPGPGRRLYVVAAVVVGLVGINAVFAMRGASLGETGGEANSYNRRGAWVAGLRMMLDRPLTGVGLYKFQEHTDHYGPAWLEQRYMKAHNSVVEVAGELGVVGLGLFLFLLGRALVGARQVRRKLEAALAGETGVEVTRVFYHLGYALQRMFAGWLVCAMFLSQAYMFWLYVAVGLIVATENMLVEAEWGDERAGVQAA